jgi:hypothetical protein
LHGRDGSEAMGAEFIVVAPTNQIIHEWRHRDHVVRDGGRSASQGSRHHQ